MNSSLINGPFGCGIVLALALSVLGASGASAEVLASYDYPGLAPGQARFGEQPFLEFGGGEMALYQYITLSNQFHGVTTGGLQLSVEVGRQGASAVPLTVRFYEGHLPAGSDLTANIVASGSVADMPTIVSGSTPPASWTSVPCTGALPGRADGKYTFAVVVDATDGHVRQFGGVGQQFGGEVDRYDGGGSDGGWGKSWNSLGGGSYPLTDPLFGTTPQWHSANFELTGTTDPVAPSVAVQVEDALAVEFVSDAGFTYELESTPDLVSSNFTGTGAFVIGNGTNMFLFDPTGTSTAKNYRVAIK